MLGPELGTGATTLKKIDFWKISAFRELTLQWGESDNKINKLTSPHILKGWKYNEKRKAWKEDRECMRSYKLNLKPLQVPLPPTWCASHHLPAFHFSPQSLCFSHIGFLAVSPTFQAYSHLRAFARAVPSTSFLQISAQMSLSQRGQLNLK